MAHSPFLELLLAGAEPSTFDQPLRAARAGNEPPERLAELEKERALALELRDILTRHRRNEAELQLLNDTANDLASLRELDAILQAIVDRARRLLDCDLTYISLSDEDRGDSYIRAESGNISGRLRGLRLPAGIGVGGLASRTGAPASVLSYFRDESIARAPETDETVAAEGIESLLGVPLKLKQRVIGVLLAAHRSQRVFSSHDISALSMLGAHAAVAIANARLLAEAQAAVEELRVANATVQSHVDDLERTAGVHERLTRLVIQGGGVTDVIEAASATVTGTVALLADDGSVVTVAGGAAKPLPEATLAPVAARARESGRTVVRDCVCAVPMLTESEFLGTVVLCGSSSTKDLDQRTLEGAALVASLVLITRRRMAEAEARVRGELLADLLSSAEGEYDLLRHRASLLGVDLDARHVVVVARGDNTARERLSAAASALARRSRGLATARNDELVLLLPGTEPADTAREAVRELSRAAVRPVTAGAARVDRGDAVAAAYQEAASCVRALLALGRAGNAADAAELGFVGLLFGSRPDLGSFVDSVIGPLVEYDEARGAELLRTLETFCATGQSTASTAQRLHLHPNTVAQRLSRISQLIGERWREPERLLEIQIALRLRKVGG